MFYLYVFLEYTHDEAYFSGDWKDSCRWLARIQLKLMDPTAETGLCFFIIYEKPKWKILLMY